MKVYKNSKIIGIGEDGIKKLESISNKLNDNICLEKINIKKDVDKEYVRTLLDGIDILFLIYSSEDKEALNIVKAIGAMANERRILSIGLNLSNKETKDNLDIDRELYINDENTDKLFNLFNIMINSTLDVCMINIDVTDLKEVIIGENGIKYSYEEFANNKPQDDMVKVLFENISKTNKDTICKKCIIFLEMGSNNLESEDMIILNNLLTLIQNYCEDTYELIFSLNLNEELNEKIRIGLICN